MRGILLAIAASLMFATAAAQPISYYPVDRDELFFWHETKPNETLTVKRVNGKWQIENTFLTDPVWQAELGRIADRETPPDQTTARALDQLMTGQVPLSFAKMRLPDAHALFVTEGDTRILFIATSKEKHFELPLDKGPTGWSKTPRVDLNTWLGVVEENDAGKILSKGLGEERDPAVGGWTTFWNAVAVSGAAAGKGYRAATYMDQKGTPRWLLIENGGPVQTLFDRVRKPLPGIPLPAAKAGGAAATGDDSNRDDDTPRTYGIATLSITFLVALAIGAGAMWLVHRLVKRDDRSEVPPATTVKVSDADVDRFATALRPAIFEALRPESASPSMVEVETKLKGLIEACNESATTAQAFGNLTCSPQKPVAALDLLPERIRNTARAVAQLETSLATANATNQQQTQWKSELDTARSEKTRLEDAAREVKPKLEKAKELAGRVTDLEEKLKTANGQLETATKLNTDTDRRIASLTSEHQRKLRSVSDQLEAMQKAFDDLGGLAERFQEGQKNHYSSRQDGPAASMLGFLANHSLQQLAVGIGMQRAEHRRYMLLNLEKIARSLPGLQGYQRALQELETKFDRQHAPSESDVKRAELRGEAPMFQFALRYLRESVNVDLAPYFFYVDESGAPYRAA